MQALHAHIAHGRAAIARGDFPCAVRAFGRALAIANRVAWGARGRILAALSFARRMLASAADAAAGAVAALIPSTLESFDASCDCACGGRSGAAHGVPCGAPSASAPVRPAAVRDCAASAGRAVAAPMTMAPGIVRAAASVLATCCAMAVRFIRAAFGPHGAVPTAGTIRPQPHGVENGHFEVWRVAQGPPPVPRRIPPRAACGPPGADR